MHNGLKCSTVGNLGSRWEFQELNYRPSNVGSQGSRGALCRREKEIVVLGYTSTDHVIFMQVYTCTTLQKTSLWWGPCGVFCRGPRIWSYATGAFIIILLGFILFLGGGQSQKTIQIYGLRKFWLEVHLTAWIPRPNGLITNRRTIKSCMRVKKFIGIVKCIVTCDTIEI